MTESNRVVIEAGTKKVFASAIDWPGLCRSAKTEDDAIDQLRQYTDRYRRVAELASVNGVVEASKTFSVIERTQGKATTDFGVPETVATIEIEPMSDEECERQIRLLRACWQYFDDVAVRVSEELQKGPRGGGRDRQKLVEHTLEADRGYARQIGVMTPKGDLDTPGGLSAHRDAVCDAIRAVNAAGGTFRKWPVRYFIRRASWHVMDHAWEMEDKDLTGVDNEH